jgi:hypothetical protein
VRRVEVEASKRKSLGVLHAVLAVLAFASPTPIFVRCDPYLCDHIACTCTQVVKTGTSMATPLVAGSAALVRQYFIDRFYPEGEGEWGVRNAILARTSTR